MKAEGRRTEGILSALALLLVSIENPGALRAGDADWYPFTPANDPFVASAFGMEDWNAEPAGTRGRIHTDSDHLVYGGEPIILWGLNNSFVACAPDKEMADRRAALYRKFGFNAVRFHKYADGPGWAGIQSQNSFIHLDPAGWRESASRRISPPAPSFPGDIPGSSMPP